MGAEFLQDKVLISGNPTHVHRLEPLIDGPRNAKCVVDGKCNVQKLQAIDAEVVQ
jgi:hypothetical protein